MATGRPVLLLLRGPRHLSVAYNWMRYLKKAGRCVVVTFKEAGSIQVAAQYTRAADLRRLAAVLDLADGCLAPTPFLMDFFDLARPPAVDPALPRRLPVADIPDALSGGRSTLGFFHSARTGGGGFLSARASSIFAVAPAPRRASRRAPQLHQSDERGCHGHQPRRPARREGARGAGVFGRSRRAHCACCRGRCPTLNTCARWRGTGSSSNSTAAACRDRSPGDALLCRLPCVGGDGAIEQIAFPDLAGHDKDPARLVEIAAAVLSDGEHYERAWRDGQMRGRRKVSRSGPWRHRGWRTFTRNSAWASDCKACRGAYLLRHALKDVYFTLGSLRQTALPVVRGSGRIPQPARLRFRAG